MASQAVVDLVVNAAGADAQIQRDLQRIANDAERSAPDITLDVRIDADSASDALAQFQRDSAGRLRDMRGRFVSESRAISAALSDSVSPASIGPNADEGGRSFGLRLLSGITGALQSGLSTAFESGLSGLRSVSASISSNPVIGGIGTAIATGVVATALPLIGTLLSGAVIAVGAIGIIGIGAALLKNEPEVRAAATQLKDSVLSVFTQAAQPLKQPFVDAMNALRDTALAVAPQIDQAFRTVAESGALNSITAGINDLVRNALPGFNQALKETGPVFEGVRLLLGQVGAGLGEFFSLLSGSGPQVRDALLDIGRAIRVMLVIIGTVFKTLTQAYGFVRSFVSNVISIFQRLYNVLVGNSIVPDLINRIISLFRGLPGRAAGALAALGSAVVSRVSAAMRSMVSSVSSGVSAAAQAVSRLPGLARSALGNLGGLLVASGRSLVSGFVSGIRSMIGAVADAASSVVSAARDFFPFSPAKRGPFSGRGYTTFSGQALVKDFAKGMLSQQRTLALATSRLFVEPNLGPLVQPSLAGTPSSSLSSGLLMGPTGVLAPTVNVFLGNRLINDHIDTRIEGNNQIRDRLADQGVRF